MTPDLRPDAARYVRTRQELHRVATHILARRRFEVSGRFGLRSSPGGFATPAFQAGPATDSQWPEVVRVSGIFLLHEVGSVTHVSTLQGQTLRDLAEFVGTDIDAPFSSGKDTPPLGDPDHPVELDTAHVGTIADWFALAWLVLDEVTSSLPASADPSTIQLWPEHFDVGTDVGLSTGERINLGFSPGDDYESEPYVYVGPWGTERPGDRAFWNAPFGATRSMAEILQSADPRQAAKDFIDQGIENASSAKS
jgi:hypothetical protein